LDILSDTERFAKYGIVWQYGVKTREREIDNETGLSICGAWAGCVTAEDQTLYKDLEHYRKELRKPKGEVCRDALFAILRGRKVLKALDKLHDASTTVFGNKTQGYAHHNYLLAICLLLEDRLGQAFVTDGDITRGQIKSAIGWANQHLQSPISLPARMNNETLLGRLKSFVPQKALLRAFLELSCNPKDEEMGVFLRTNFAAEDIVAYWKSRAKDSTPSTLGAQDFFKEYFAMSDDLSLLTQVCLKKYTPKEYAKHLAASRIFEETKETRDPAMITGVSSERSTPEPISVVMAKALNAAARNPATARYIPIEKGIAEITPIIRDAERLITEAMEKRKPFNAEFEDAMKTYHEDSEQCDQDADSVDIADCEDLVFYERGDTLSEAISIVLKSIREFIDNHRAETRKQFDSRYGQEDIDDKMDLRMAILAHSGTDLLPKTAWDFFESRICDDIFFDTILGLHVLSLGSDIVPICQCVKGILCSPELLEDVLLKPNE